MAEAEQVVRQAVVAQLADVCQRIEAGEPLHDTDRAALLRVSQESLSTLPPPQEREAAAS
jgi:hypothetical protein